MCHYTLFYLKFAMEKMLEQPNHSHCHGNMSDFKEEEATSNQCKLPNWHFFFFKQRKKIK